MPGPISSSYDPEWGSGENAQEIEDALGAVYERLSQILGHKQPIYILDLVRQNLPEKTTATLTEKEWRLLRFAVERAKESI